MSLHVVCLSSFHIHSFHLFAGTMIISSFMHSLHKLQIFTPCLTSKLLVHIKFLFSNITISNFSIINIIIINHYKVTLQLYAGTARGVYWNQGADCDQPLQGSGAQAWDRVFPSSPVAGKGCKWKSGALSLSLLQSTSRAA